MILYNPLGLLALLSLPAIVWLHRYVMWGQRKQVSCLNLWLDPELLQAEGRAKRKPPLTWVLLLELLAATFLSLALAGLEWQDARESHPHVGIVVDSSASMAGGELGATAFDETREIIQQLTSDDDSLRLSIVVSGDRPKLLGGRALSPTEALAQLTAYRPNDIHHSLNAALELLSLLVAEPEQTLVFSDDPHFQHPRAIDVGKPIFNAGIVAASWQAGTDPFVAVRCFDDPAEAINLTMVLDGDQANSSTLPLNFKAAGEKPLSLPVPAGTQQVDVYLPADGLAIDNHITLIRPPVHHLNLRIAHPAPRVQTAFKRLAQALPTLQLSQQVSTQLIVLADNFKIENSFAVVFPATSDGRPQLYPNFTVDAFNPLMAGFDPQGLVWYGDKKSIADISPSFSAKPGSKGKPQLLLQSGETPLIWQTDDTLVFNLEFERSNFFQHNAFPVLFHNLMEKRKQAQGGLQHHNYRVGETLHFVRPSNWVGDLKIGFPSGDIQTFNGTDIRVGVLEETGIYTLQTDNDSARFAVNFLDAREGALHLRATTNKQATLQYDTVISRDRNRPLSQAMILLAVLLLLAAWILLRPMPTAYLGQK